MADEQMKTNKHIQTERLIASRRQLVDGVSMPEFRDHEAEGGCGVVGLAASFPVAGRHLVPAARQMHNRGNGKGGGIAAAGLSAEQMGVSEETLRDATLLQIAFLDPTSQKEVEAVFVTPAFDVLEGYRVPTVDDYRDVPGLEMKPPDVWRYFVRAKEDVLGRFARENDLESLPARRLEDEFVYQNTFRLNTQFYASLGDQRAFVLSHGRDLVVFKIVGYAEQSSGYYCLEDMAARVWISHQRYPTKGRVWHPGGAHPFIGLNEALVHNGDFANYHAVATYLRQRNIVPLFLTDTEVSVLLFDLLDRLYQYPLEATIEALAPTTERDFTKLPEEKQQLYRAIQASHIHASPDGPWFFIIARSQPDEQQWQLLGITDTSMLRPQVFAVQETEIDGENLQIGIIASEKQAIDATLQSLHAENPLICPVADRYWNARGGSYSDGGSFAFTVTGEAPHNGVPRYKLSCTDKFGNRVEAPQGQVHYQPAGAFNPGFEQPSAAVKSSQGALQSDWLVLDDLDQSWNMIAGKIVEWSYDDLIDTCRGLVDLAGGSDSGCKFALALLARMRDWVYDPGKKRRASMVAIIDEAARAVLAAVPLPRNGGGDNGRRMMRLDWESRAQLPAPHSPDDTLVVDVAGFAPEGDDGPARLIVRAVEMGWRNLVTYGWRGQRFAGCGLGPNSQGVRIDVYGSSGDYLGSGLDGAEIHVHGSAQDQIGQIMNSGKLVIHGEVGQTFLYGAKGGDAYIRGNAAGRPLINAVGSPRVVINGTCLDYLAESFMAGDPLNGGGFAVLNGITFDDHGNMIDLPEPYPGGNLFSLASGGAIYIRDPRNLVNEDQLNGGQFSPLTDDDWQLILPYLQENERLFGIPVSALLTIDGDERKPAEIYRKVAAMSLGVLK